jgi:hypothetical protein
MTSAQAADCVECPELYSGNGGVVTIGLHVESEGGYPEDIDLRQSFRLFAESGDLQDEYAAADCANARTPECANLVMENLDEWAVWYETNG